MHRRRAVLGFGDQDAVLVYPQATHAGNGLLVVGAQLERVTLAVDGAQHERRVLEVHEHALRAVLEVPAAALVAGVVAADELGDKRIGAALALQQPLPAPVEPQPPIDSGYAGPLGHPAQDDFIHGGNLPWATTSAAARLCPASGAPVPPSGVLLLLSVSGGLRVLVGQVLLDGRRHRI